MATGELLEKADITQRSAQARFPAFLRAAAAAPFVSF